MNIYLVDYWAPFPESEYGGLQVVIAEDKEQCIEMLVRATDEYEKKGNPAYRDMITIEVNNALCYPLVGTHPPKIVKSFLT